MPAPLEQFLLTLAAALSGTWIAARLALDRYRRERVFDRRMDWYERALAAARTLHLAVGLAILDLAQGGQDQLRAARRIRHASLKLTDILVAAALYARKELLPKLQSHIDQVGELHVALVPLPPSETEEASEKYRALAAITRQMQHDLARFGRLHLEETSLTQLRAHLRGNRLGPATKSRDRHP